MTGGLGRETDICILRKMQIDELNPSLRRRFPDRVDCTVPYRLRASPAHWTCAA